MIMLVLLIVIETCIMRGCDLHLTLPSCKCISEISLYIYIYFKKIFVKFQPSDFCIQELFEGYYFCQAQREDFFQRAKPYEGHPTILR